MSNQESRKEIEALLQETRSFPPPEEFRRKANVSDPAVGDRAAADPEAFWADWARKLDWMTPFRQTLDWKPPHAKWFLGGTLNASVNCLDRHLNGPRRHKAALVFEGEPGDSRVLTYQQLHSEVCKLGSALRSLGIRKGDRVCIYLPMIPEAVVSMLACARIGAIHSVVFGGFSSDSLKDRTQDAEAKVVITADGGWRRGQVVPLKKTTDEAVAQCPSVQKVVVVKRGDFNVEMKGGRDVWYHDLMAKASPDCPPEPMAGEDPLFMLYTSGTTGKPKGILHSTAGYLTGVTATMNWVFDIKDEDLFWCTADIGWITGHSYVVYGPLSNGASILLYEGSPDWPERDRFWRIIEKYRATILYTAPTAIRAFMKWGVEHPKACDLTSLRLLGSVGEPINPEAWMWYYENIGGGRCPIVDTWWQTETGMILITPLPGIHTLRPASANRPFPGVDACVLDSDGNEIRDGGGYLAIRKPWPAMLLTIWGDDERYRKTYWSRWPNVYFPADGARIDKDRNLWLLGRVDDVLNVSGHRIGTMEVESALVDNPLVAEAAVVGINHEIKGTAIAAFVTLKGGKMGDPETEAKLKKHVSDKIGAIARPEKILFTADLPKTRSGKIMRRLLRDIAEGRTLGDTTTLADPTVVAKLKDEYETKEQ